MRIVKSFDDVNIVIKPIQDFISLFSTKDFDRRKLRLKNNGDAVDPQDYVTLHQLESSTQAVATPDQFFTVVFSNQGVPNVGSAFPNWVTGINRDGIPIEIWGMTQGGAVAGSFVFNVLLNGVALLTSSISIGAGIVTPVHSSSFINPIPKLGKYSTMVPTIVSANGASNISIGVVVKRNQ